MRVLLAVALIAATAAAWVNPPAFCNGINCPQYDSVCNGTGFEIRTYPKAQWVSVDFQGPSAEDFDNVGQEGFHFLFDYISGANAAGASIDMTCPVTTRIVPGSGPNCNTTFTVSFFIPFKYQGTAPAPTNPRVYIREQDTMTVAVASFGGFVIDWSLSVAPEFLALGNALNAANIPFTQAEEWTAEYNGPFTIFNRHNEVWYDVAADTKKC